MPYDPNEPRDERGRWARIGAGAKAAGKFALAAGAVAVPFAFNALLKGTALAASSKALDDAANRSILRQADQLRRYNNKIAGQRTKHPRDVPHVANPVGEKRVKAVDMGNVAPEALNKLNRELLRAEALRTAPARAEAAAVKIAKLATGALAPTAYAGGAKQETFVRPPGWKGMGTGLRPTGVARTISGSAENSVKLKVPPPSVHVNRNLDPYKPAMKNTRAVQIKRTEEYPPSRYTTRTVVRRKLPKA